MLVFTYWVFCPLSWKFWFLFLLLSFLLLYWLLLLLLFPTREMTRQPLLTSPTVAKLHLLLHLLPQHHPDVTQLSWYLYFPWPRFRQTKKQTNQNFDSIFQYFQSLFTKLQMRNMVSDLNLYRRHSSTNFPCFEVSKVFIEFNSNRVPGPYICRH